MKRNFIDLLEKRWTDGDTLLCVGLDSEYEKIPQVIKSKYPKIEKTILEFNKQIIDATAEYVCSFKTQYAFYGAQGIEGYTALEKTIEYIHTKYPNIPVIVDGKRNDIGNTMEAYAQEMFNVLNADAATITPYLGFDGIEPFLKRVDQGTIILCRTSNKSAGDFQDIIDKKTKKPLYQLVAEKAKEWNVNKNICLVVGATYREEMKLIRKIVGNGIPFLVPGLGAQGGKPEEIAYGFNSKKTGIIAHSARGIIFASREKDFAQAAASKAKELRDEINRYR